MPVSPFLKANMQLDFKRFLADILSSREAIEMAVFSRRSIFWKPDPNQAELTEINLSAADALHVFADTPVLSDEDSVEEWANELQARGLKVEIDRLIGTRNKLGKAASKMSWRELAIIDAAISEAGARLQIKYAHLIEEQVALNNVEMDLVKPKQAAVQEADERIRQQQEILNSIHGIYHTSEATNELLAQFKFDAQQSKTTEEFVCALNSAIAEDKKNIEQTRVSEFERIKREIEILSENRHSRNWPDYLKEIESIQAPMREIAQILNDFAVFKEEFLNKLVELKEAARNEDDELSLATTVLYFEKMLLTYRPQYRSLLRRNWFLTNEKSALPPELVEKELRIVHQACKSIENIFILTLKVLNDLDPRCQVTNLQDRVNLLDQFYEDFAALPDDPLQNLDPVYAYLMEEMRQSIEDKYVIRTERELSVKQKQQDALNCIQPEVSAVEKSVVNIKNKVEKINLAVGQHLQQIDELNIEKLFIVDIDDFLLSQMEPHDAHCAKCPPRDANASATFFNLLKAAQDKGFTPCLVTSININQSFSAHRKDEVGLLFDRIGFIEALKARKIDIDSKLIFDDVKTKETSSIKKIVQSVIKTPHKPVNHVEAVLSDSILLGKDFTADSNVMNRVTDAQIYLRTPAESRDQLAPTLGKAIFQEMMMSAFGENVVSAMALSRYHKVPGELASQIMTNNEKPELAVVSLVEHFQKLCADIKITNETKTNEIISAYEQLLALKQKAQQLLQLMSHTNFYQVAINNEITPAGIRDWPIQSLLENSQKKIDEIMQHPQMQAKQFLEQAENYLLSKEWQVGWQLLGRKAAVVINGKEKRVPHTVKKQLDVIANAKRTGEYVAAKKIFLQIYTDKHASQHTDFFTFSSASSRKYFNIFIEAKGDLTSIPQKELSKAKETMLTGLLSERFKFKC